MKKTLSIAVPQGTGLVVYLWSGHEDSELVLNYMYKPPCFPPYE